MISVARAIIKRGATAGIILLAPIAALLAAPTVSAAQERSSFITVGGIDRPPVGWVEFCVEYDPECKTKPSAPRDVVLSPRAWKMLWGGGEDIASIVADVNRWSAPCRS
jgi:predicted transglutaminase-like cysteine proteinase